MSYIIEIKYKMSLGSIEPRFYGELRTKLGIEARDWPIKADGRGDDGHAYLEQLIQTKTRAEWCALLEGSESLPEPNAHQNLRIIAAPSLAVSTPILCARGGCTSRKRLKSAVSWGYNRPIKSGPR